MKFRVSTPADVPALKNLWFLSFHDQGDYMNHFFHQYCTPDKMLVAEEEGQVVAMTAWFGSTLHHGGARYEFAYLYGVGTHPDWKNRGIASQLLAYVYDHVVELGYAGVTTVPAEPSLHGFFGRNGFQECFLQQVEVLTACPEGEGTLPLEKLSPEAYRSRRAKFLGENWVDYHQDGHKYQAGVCDLGRGGLFASGESLCVLEEGGEGFFVVKELLGGQEILPALWQLVSPEKLEVRRPVKFAGNLGNLPGNQKNIQEFGMIQWLTTPPSTWNEDIRGFLGMGFD